WVDEWELKVGDSLHECIGRALEEAAYVGVILSPASVQSRWCRAELDQALTREKRIGRTVVLPLLYRRVPIPPFLEGRVYLSFSKSYYGALTQLVGFLHDVPLRVLSRELASKKPRSVREVAEIIRPSNSSIPHVSINKEDYNKLYDLFKKYDV